MALIQLTEKHSLSTNTSSALSLGETCHENMLSYEHVHGIMECLSNYIAQQCCAKTIETIRGVSPLIITPHKVSPLIIIP